jgi:hypothetical protein
MARPKSLVLPSDPLLLQALLKGLAMEKQELDAKISAVNAALGKGRPGRKPKSAAPAEEASAAAPASGPKTKRVLSAAARARIAAAQKKRWAAFRKDS